MLESELIKKQIKLFCEMVCLSFIPYYDVVLKSEKQFSIVSLVTNILILFLIFLILNFIVTVRCFLLC